MSSIVNKDVATADALYATQSGFIPVEDSDEYLHSDNPDVGYELSETSYLGFNVPEAALSCEIYHWFHPRFGLVSGGVMIFQGVKQRTGEAEYLDYRNFMPAPTDIAQVRYDTGVEIEVVKPLDEIHVRFDAPDGRASFDVVLKAVTPPAGRLDGKHFAQVMRTRGSVTVNGVRHRVDGYFTRDRSYLAPRPEISHPIPPQSWATAMFGDDLAVHFIGADGPDVSADNLRWGCVWRNNELRSPTGMRLSTTPADDGVTPATIDVAIEDQTGERYLLQGKTIAMLPMNFWPNMVTHLVLCEWQWEGRTGYGDLQYIAFGQWLHEQAKDREGIR